MRTISIEQLAELLNGKLWTKNELKRIYLDAGYNTKKMTTKTYVYEKNARFVVVCNIECPSQADQWINSQENEIIDSINERIAGIIEEHGYEVEDPMEAIEAELAAEPQVQGYYMEWKEVRVAINSYGKLATRKRQFIETYRGPKSQAPYGFIELNDADFEVAWEKSQKGRAYEYGCEPNLVGEADRIAERNAKEEAQEKAAAERAALEAKQKAEADQAKAAELAEKIAAFKASGGTDVLKLWKMEGCPHPAPLEVAQAKEASGLGWRAFTNSIEI